MVRMWVVGFFLVHSGSSWVGLLLRRLSLNDALQESRANSLIEKKFFAGS